MAGSSGTGPRGAGNGQPGAKAAAGDDLARAERFLSPGGADPDAVSGTVDLNPAVVRTTSWCDTPRRKPNVPGASSGGDGNPVAAIDDTAMEGHGSRNGTLWKGARLNPHQKMPCVACADNCALAAT